MQQDRRLWYATIIPCVTLPYIFRVIFVEEHLGDKYVNLTTGKTAYVLGSELW